MQRVMIIGPGNAGKSTLAKKLGERLDIPVYHLDQYFWQANWTPKPTADWESDHLKLLQGKSWVIEGDFGKLYNIRASHADTIIFLNMPVRVIIPRSFIRRIRYRGKTRPDMAAGNIEKLDLGYIKWLLRYNRKRALLLIKENSSKKNTIVLKSPRHVKAFLQDIR